MHLAVPVAAAPRHALPRRLLGLDPVQRRRLARALLALAVMCVGALVMGTLVAREARPAPLLLAAWMLWALGGALLCCVLIRSGASLRWRDPALTQVQMLHALSSAVAAYALAGPLRGAVLPVLMLLPMFGMFALPPRALARVGGLALVLLGAVMAWRVAQAPALYRPGVEAGHFVMLAATLSVAVMLAARVARMRRRLQQQRQELALALARNREIATRDEATGLVNRRHMLELLEQEHQRSVRSGRGFCIALLQVRGGDAGGPDDAGAEQRLREAAQALQAAIRLSDLLGRGQGAHFVLLLSDTRLSLARTSVERLRERVAALPAAEDEALSLQTAVVEHLAGESVAQSLQRAERLLGEAGAPRAAAA